MNFSAASGRLTTISVDELQSAIQHHEWVVHYQPQIDFRSKAVELKIDKSFVMHMHDNSNAQIIVDQTIQMAHKLELQVVAEGVETAQAWAKLADAGCDIAQGFVVSRPLAAEKFTAFLTANAWREELIN